MSPPPVHGREAEEEEEAKRRHSTDRPAAGGGLSALRESRIVWDRPKKKKEGFGKSLDPSAAFHE
jgi:hypothetical protein